MEKGGRKMDGYCLLKKTVDKSVLYHGFAIPSEFQSVFYQQLGFTLKPGESREIRLLVNRTEYPLKITNSGFDRNKFHHVDQLLIRYGENHPLAREFRRVFRQTDEKVRAFYETREGGARYIPKEEEKELLAIYATPVAGVLLVDCITQDEYREEQAEIRQCEEIALEQMIDSGASIETKIGTKKVRKLTRAIGNNLKIIYGYRCQICGQYIGENYGSHVIHAHHIDYFVKSLNNDADNILIVCPNHHAVIHDTNPVFDRPNLEYLYPNGFREKLRLNLHL